jgi:hypothetical protein
MSSRAAARKKNAKRAKVQDAAEDETADVAQGRRADGLAEEDGISRDEVGVEPRTSELSLAGSADGDNRSTRRPWQKRARESESAAVWKK